VVAINLYLTDIIIDLAQNPTDVLEYGLMPFFLNKPFVAKSWHNLKKYYNAILEIPSSRPSKNYDDCVNQGIIRADTEYEIALCLEMYYARPRKPIREFFGRTRLKT
jgi:hypothetical protein